MTALEFREIRQSLRLSQSKLAKLLNFTFGQPGTVHTVQSWEQGWRKVPPYAAKFMREKKEGII